MNQKTLIKGLKIQQENFLLKQKIKIQQETIDNMFLKSVVQQDEIINLENKIQKENFPLKQKIKIQQETIDNMFLKSVVQQDEIINLENKINGEIGNQFFYLQEIIKKLQEDNIRLNKLVRYKKIDDTILRKK